MTNITFYLLSDTSNRSIELLACQLIAKAYAQQNFVYINAQNSAQASRLNELLWTFNPESFIPHLNLSDENSQTEDIDNDFIHPVIINTGEEIRNDLNPERKEEVLINLSSDVPIFFSRFHRLAELVDTSEEKKKEARLRFKFYKDKGYPMSTHDIT